ncbi:MAG: ATP-dependent DNA helicase RecG, partial [Candidatus Dormibacteria bacterium]
YRRTTRGVGMVEAFLSDDTGRMKALWFNQPYVAQQLHQGDELVLSGKVVRQGRGTGLVMMNPAFERGEAGLHTGRLVPVYRETAGLTSRWMRPRVSQALEVAFALADHLPREIEARLRLPALPEAVRQLHFPGTADELQTARKRLALNQLLLLQLAVLLYQGDRAQLVAPVVPYDVDRARQIRDTFSFTLTNAQRKAAHAVFTDISQPRPMARLLQGDVGSGKTAVAAMAAAMVARSGQQVLFMAPTEILAQQHARTLQPYMDALKVPMALLAGSTPQKERRRILEGVSDGSLQLLVGTHALVEESVVPARLALVITDEQHRFGTGQRAALSSKGESPHVLQMTATPIPRTLQLTVFGDLTVSVLDELPPGRVPVQTRLVKPAHRREAYDFVRGEVAAGRQAFVICPLVEDSERILLRSAEGEYRRLQDTVFPELRLALLHGRMRPAEKDTVMTAFKAGESDILVSTSVVEVGVDVPNASVMMIEGADRFGLAQLHQFRGRVGRGEHAAFCLLMTEVDSPTQNARLEAMVRYSSGFDLAEVDLEIRGPGDVLGATVQSGHATGLMVAGLLDARLISLAREEAERLMASGLDRHAGLEAAARAFRAAGTLS